MPCGGNDRAALFQETRMLAHIRDTAIYFDVDGVGLAPVGPAMVERPTAFVIHGGPGGDHSAFKTAFQPLTADMQLVYFDHRGQGRSQRDDPSRYTLDENVEDMEALRLHLGCGPIVSIGTSYGGMVAMAHAARYPDSVSHLVLIVTAAHAGFNARARAIVDERGTPAQIAVCEQLWAGGLNTDAKLREFYAIMGPLYSTTHDPMAPPSRSRGILAPDALNQAFSPGGFLQSYDLRPELAAITAPTLILAGRHDWICPPEFSEEIHGLIKGSTFRVFEQSSHSIRSDEPEAMRATIAAFVTAERPSPG
jgi:proline iminopeptidase